jgi:TPR repeat protein
MAAAQGHARAQCLAAGCYAAGRGVQQDLARALEWYVRSADQGDSDALFNAGFFFDRGRGTAPDPARAVRYYSLAAGKDPRAMFNLGKCLEAGRGTAMNLSGAVELYTTAAGMGHHAAQHRLSQLYREGIGVKKDRRKADFWLKKSQER